MGHIVRSCDDHVICCIIDMNYSCHYLYITLFFLCMIVTLLLDNLDNLLKMLCKI